MTSISRAASTTKTMTSSVFHRRLDREPLHAVRAEGNYIYLEDGHKLLDGGVSAAVTSIGYGDKRVIAGIVDQLQNVAFGHSGTFTTKVSYLDDQNTHTSLENALKQIATFQVKFKLHEVVIH
jgi:adenosylmethionine-8-amino-7-oxononanoate aminotransferase